MNGFGRIMGTDSSLHPKLCCSTAGEHHRSCSRGLCSRPCSGQAPAPPRVLRSQHWAQGTEGRDSPCPGAASNLGALASLATWALQRVRSREVHSILNPRAWAVRECHCCPLAPPGVPGCCGLYTAVGAAESAEIQSPEIPEELARGLAAPGHCWLLAFVFVNSYRLRRQRQGV